MAANLYNSPHIVKFYFNFFSSGLFDRFLSVVNYLSFFVFIKKYCNF